MLDFKIEVFIENNNLEYISYIFPSLVVYHGSDDEYFPKLGELCEIYNSLNREIETDFKICNDITIKFYAAESNQIDTQYLNIPIGISIASHIRMKFMDEINKLINIMANLETLQPIYEGIQKALVFNCKFLLEKYVNTNLNKKIIEWKFASFDDSLQSLLYFMIYNNNHKIIKILLDNNILINQDDINCMKNFGDSTTQKLICNSPQYINNEFNHKRKAED